MLKAVGSGGDCDKLENLWSKDSSHHPPAADLDDPEIHTSVNRWPYVSKDYRFLGVVS